MKLPIFFILFLALPLNGQNLQEDISRQYYQSAKNKDYIIARKVLESCHDNKQCNRVRVMEDALNKAKSNKDSESVFWISSELTLAQQSFLQRRLILIRFAAGVAVGVTIGASIAYYLMTRESDPFS